MTETLKQGTGEAPDVDGLVRHLHVDLNGVRLHYVTAGEGEPMVFVHGFPGFWYVWRHQIAEFSRDHFVAAPDMRGHGLSSKPGGAPYYGVRILVEDVRALVRHLGYERFTLVGDDWGGLVSWAFALYYPAMLKRLIVVSSPHPALFDRELKENPEQQQASQYLLALRRPGAEQQLAADDFAILKATILDLPFRTRKDHAAFKEAWSQRGMLTGGLDWYRAAWLGPPAEDGTVAHGNYVPEVIDQVVRVPTLVVKAQGSPYFLDGTLEGLEEYVADLTVKRVPTQSHWIADEKPEILNAHIREFLGA